MTSNPTSWPKAYLLQVYAAAVRDGFIYIQPITYTAARSFKATFLRVRRRSDTVNKQWIIPEYHLVTVGTWEPLDDRPLDGDRTLGRLPILYNQMPSGLPSIVSAAADLTPSTAIDFASIDQPTLAPKSLPQPFTQPLTPVNPDAPPPPTDIAFDINSFVSTMRKKVEDSQ